MVPALGRNVQDGDELHFAYPADKRYGSACIFYGNEITVSQGEAVQLQLRQSSSSGSSFSNCEGASIYIDGVKQEDILPQMLMEK